METNMMNLDGQTELNSLLLHHAAIQRDQNQTPPLGITGSLPPDLGGYPGNEPLPNPGHLYSEFGPPPPVNRDGGPALQGGTKTVPRKDGGPVTKPGSFIRPYPVNFGGGPTPAIDNYTHPAYIGPAVQKPRSLPRRTFRQTFYSFFHTPPGQGNL